jgi:hypothetical protein
MTNSSDVLYVGVNNPIILKGKDLSTANVAIVNGTLKELPELSSDTVKTYIVRVDNNNPTFISIKQHKKTTTLKYRNKNIPNPEVVITSDSSRIRSCSISERQFRTAFGLGCNIPAFDYGISMKIISYKLTIIKNGKTTSHSGKGNVVKNYTQSADSSDIFIFHDVLMEFLETNEQRLLNGPTVFVK